LASAKVEMARLEDLENGASVKGILPDCLVSIVDVKWHGSMAKPEKGKEASLTIRYLIPRR
jgi:hypothetical protein